MIDYETYCKIIQLHQKQLKPTQISRNLSLDLRTVLHWIEEGAYRLRETPKRESKLDPYKPQILRWLEQQFSVEKFTIRDGSITTQYDGKTGGVWDGLEFVCSRLDDGCDYTMNLTRSGPNGHEASCDGRIDVGW